MAMHYFESEQLLPTTLDEAWTFIASPRNLDKITPTAMNFRITDKHQPERMYAGQIINYTVSPLWGVRVRWTTEITHLKEKEYFVDEQRFGPFRFWQHQHLLKETPAGIEMQDRIHYKIPGGIAGDILNNFLIREKISEIFEYRRKMLKDIFCGC
jgi:ligand-binding SRPBCC domain-containing protein